MSHNADTIKSIFKAEIQNRIENSKYYIKMSKGAISLEERKNFDSQAWIEGVKLPALLNDLEKLILKALKEE